MRSLTKQQTIEQLICLEQVSRPVYLAVFLVLGFMKFYIISFICVQIFSDFYSILFELRRDN